MEKLKCTKCNQELPVSEFGRKKSNVARGGYQYHCKSCRNKDQQEMYRKDISKSAEILKRSRENNKIVHWFNGKRQNARKDGIDFDIDLEDVPIPEKCPLIGIKLEFGKGKPWAHSPTIDRIDPEKGYIKGNVWVVSHKANTMKSNATLDEVELLYFNLKRKKLEL